MAILNKPIGERPFDTGDFPPEGTFIATCIDIKDEFGVQRKKFQSEEMETCDVTTFLFGFRDGSGHPYKIASRTMKISGHEKSGLYKFLRQWLGKAPQYGWDYCELKGSQALVTVEHVPNRDQTNVFPNIASISPVPTGFVAQQGAPQSVPQVAPAPQAMAKPNGGNGSSATRYNAPPPPSPEPIDEIPF